MKGRPDILFEDADLLVVNKPAGWLSIPDRQKKEKTNLRDWLTEQKGPVWVVHRLDRETSGVMCFARNEAAHRHLSLQFSGREVGKTYLALVEGIPPEPTGTIDRAIVPHPTVPGKMMCSNKGKPARSHFQVMEVFRFCSLLKVTIETGRTHQIRVHLADIGFPLLVDALYGQRDQLTISDVKRWNLAGSEQPRPLLARIALHAFSLRLRHPATEEEMEFTAPLPKDLKATLNQLRKWGK